MGTWEGCLFMWPRLSKVPIRNQGYSQSLTPLAQGHRKLCRAITVFAFEALLAIRKMTFQDHAQRNIKIMVS